MNWKHGIGLIIVIILVVVVGRWAWKKYGNAGGGTAAPIAPTA
jgi:hypothetical protein